MLNMMRGSSEGAKHTSQSLDRTRPVPPKPVGAAFTKECSPYLPHQPCKRSWSFPPGETRRCGSWSPSMSMRVFVKKVNKSTILGCLAPLGLANTPLQLKVATVSGLVTRTSHI